ncbi:hypothetical protein LguiB_024662 [Lonicera macranthoides]
MPPSPATRCSPRRESRADNHKRGRSLESGILLRDKDDDLALFNEVQSREKDNFLLQSNDDFEDTFSTKLRYFSDQKLGISVPIRGESSDLLNAEGEKNDYDWLLTPPDTPLFPSLDDEAPPVNHAQRGRPRSQPISISRSSTMEKSYRSSRGSASPNRLSPSPRSGNSMFQSRGRSSSSAPNSSPTPSLRPATPTRKPSPPPSKPSTPVTRSSTPTPRRLSTGSNGVRGVSPIKTGRGNSASPKIRAWQSNIPGFSSEAPPNLRTSLADRPASYVRGTSPASRNGRESSSKSGRQSMSPTASRSINSSYSHDRDQFSSHSKGSMASSCDDDADSPQSISVGSLDRATARRGSALPNNRAPAFSKKPMKTLPSSSAPKRSFDIALRQMDQRKSPQNMFRPLLSSVPSSTFHAGKTSAAHRSLVSRNSSVTTSSNASSDQGTNGVHDAEGSEQNQEDATSEYVKAPGPVVLDEVFVFDKADDLNEDIRHVIHGGSPSGPHSGFNGDPILDSQLGGVGNVSSNDTALAITAMSEALDVNSDFADSDGFKNMAFCSKCGRRYSIIKPMEGDLRLCAECRRSDIHSTITSPLATTLVADNSPTKNLEGYDSFDVREPLMDVPESSEVTSTGEPRADQHEEIVKEGQTSYSEPIWNFLSENSIARTLVEEGDQRHSNQQLIGDPTVSCSITDGDAGGQQMQHSNDGPNLKVNGSEGAGISVLLKRSSSGKGPVVQSRTFTASSIPYNDPSYVRDSVNSVRSSFGHGSSASASSSLDLGSTRQSEARFQRQVSANNYEMSTKHHRTVSSSSGTSYQGFQPLGFATSAHKEGFEVSVAHSDKDVDVICVADHDQLLASENTVLDNTRTDVESNYKCRTMIASTSELSSHIRSVHSRGSSGTSFSNFDESVSCENGEDLTNNAKNIRDAEESAVDLESSTLEEDARPNCCVDRVDVEEVPPHISLDTISEIEIENVHQDSPGSQSDISSPNSKSSIDELHEVHVPAASEKHIAAVAESDPSNHVHGILEESTVKVGVKGGAMARNVTLEEATDTILFCSSIIHNLAYDAASIAMEKENEVPWEGSKPMVTILGKPNSDKKEPRGRTAGKRSLKSQKARQKRVETTEAKPPINTTNTTDERSDVSNTRIVGIPSNDDNMKPPKLESKCNCTVM